MIRDRLSYGRRIPWRTTKREIKRGRDITWTLRAMPAPEWVMEQWPGSATFIAVRTHGTRAGKTQDETSYYVSSLRTGAKAMLKAFRQRWSIENSWHWVRDVPLREDAHRYRENNGVQILATLRSMAINALRLEGIWSITEGIAALAHDIKGFSAAGLEASSGEALRITSNRPWAWDVAERARRQLGRRPPM